MVETGGIEEKSVQNMDSELDMEMERVEGGEEDREETLMALRAT